ncbi:SDR family oxidoreductase [Dyadobacter sp. OTU695]|uniref:SDR family oxidoreductase n=1 Tax=Dyadobacter sp. OTU695 TaxID=3043860 RepID=UPI00313D612D
MKIVVIGGSGLIGSKVVSNLTNLGHQVIAGSPATGINTITGEGLSEALKGADIVIDVANSPSFEDQAVLDFFTTSGTNLLAAEKETGVQHHIALSVVGTQLLAESGYFRGKIMQEKLIRESGMPYTIVHSTQFFEFLGGIAQSATQGQIVRLSAAYVQPISSDDVASAVTELALDTPRNGVVEIAGPERFRLAELVQKFLNLKGDTRSVVTDSQARYYGALLSDVALLPAGDARVGSVNFADWFKATNV